MNTTDINTTDMNALRSLSAEDVRAIFKDETVFSTGTLHMNSILMIGWVIIGALGSENDTVISLHGGGYIGIRGNRWAVVDYVEADNEGIEFGEDGYYTIDPSGAILLDGMYFIAVSSAAVS